MRKRTITLGMLGAAALAACTGCGTGLGIGPEHTTHQSFTPTGQVRLITVASGSGTVRITPGSSVEVERTVRYNGDDPSPLSEPVNGTLDLGNCARCATDYTVTAPAGTALEINSGSGHVTVSGFTAPVTVKAGSGDVDVRQLSGTVRLTTESGDISAADLSNDAQFAAGSGHIDAAFTKPVHQVTATGGSGDVALKLPHGAYQVNAAARSGSQKVDVENRTSSPYQVTVRTGSGRITISNSS